MKADTQPKLSGLAAILARHWTEQRAYFSLHEVARREGLQASWERAPDHTLDLHWSRRDRRHSERRPGGAARALWLHRNRARGDTA